MIHASDDSINFYDKIAAFSHFSEVTDDRHYQLVPEDWYVVITDVIGSTKEIEKNRYKEVNLVGASSISAILNALGSRRVPYVFGGDGCTALIHRSDVEKVKPALKCLKKVARDVFKIEIRVGMVPGRRLYERGVRLEVAKFQVSETAQLAMIRGGALQLAERLVKTNHEFQFESEAASPEDFFKGLSCRWNSVPSKNGEVVSLLVMALGKIEEANSTYRKVLSEIDRLLGTGNETCPITFEGLSQRRMSLRGIRDEIRLRIHGKTWGAKLKAIGKVLFSAIYINGSVYLKIKPPFFDPEKYVRDLALGTDFRKFDDMLRMIRDCSKSQREELSRFLESLKNEGKIVYGMHVSGQALMTCLVFSLSEHVHFVDGAGGGYAMAASQLKAQLQAHPSFVKNS